MKKVIVKNHFEKYDKLSQELGEGIEKSKSTLSDTDREEIIKELDEIDDIFERILTGVKK